MLLIKQFNFCKVGNKFAMVFFFYCFSVKEVILLIFCLTRTKGEKKKYPLEPFEIEYSPLSVSRGEELVYIISLTTSQELITLLCF